MGEIKTLHIVMLLAAIAALYVVLNIFQATLRARATPGYWQARMDESYTSKSMYVLALGDSATQAIGASQPDKGFVGRAAICLSEITDRPTHVVNHASGGASLADITEQQIKPDEVRRADLIIVAAPSDAERKLDAGQYERDLRVLLARLPSERTIVSGIPPMPGGEKYQEITERVSRELSFQLAEVGEVFKTKVRRFDLFSWLPPHLNDVGYGYWYEAFAPSVSRIATRLDVRETSR